MPQKAINTVIVDPQSLIRDVLSSLLVAHSFHVVGSWAAIRKCDDVDTGIEDVDLTLLSGQSLDHAVDAAEILISARPSSKVVFLFDELSADELRRLCNSSITGCVSLHLSHDVLMRALDFIVSENVRLFALDEVLTTKKGRNVHQREQSSSGDQRRTNAMLFDEVQFGEGRLTPLASVRGNPRRH